MTYFAGLLRGQTIADVYSDSEVTYLMLANGTQITIRGEVLIQPAAPAVVAPAKERDTHPA